MPVSQEYAYVSAESIIIDREARQRRDLKIDEEFLGSLRRHGVLNPVIVDRDMKLMAGERRVTGCLQLGLQVPIRFFDTLSPIEARIVEYEENLRRRDLEWKDEVNAIGDMHRLYHQLDDTWNQQRTAQAIGIDQGDLSRILQVHAQMDNPRVAGSTGWRPAYNVISRTNSRVADKITTELMEDASRAFATVATPVVAGAAPQEPITPPSEPAKVLSILQENFLEWAPAYNGPKFNLLHCDFPYGINAFRPGGFIGPGGSAAVEYEDNPEDYWDLVACLLDNLDGLLSHSAHMIFWFSMQNYEETREALQRAFIVSPYPLLWLKSDNAGVAPDPKRGPRQIYETAFYCYRGDRPVVKVVSNGYASPTDKTIHPSAKPEPMLKHFLGMVTDGTTRLLDPTAGGGSSLRAAEDLGAEFVLGLELDPEHVENANAAMRKARVLRGVTR